MHVNYERLQHDYYSSMGFVALLSGHEKAECQQSTNQDHDDQSHFGCKVRISSEESWLVY